MQGDLYFNIVEVASQEKKNSRNNYLKQQKQLVLKNYKTYLIKKTFLKNSPFLIKTYVFSFFKRKELWLSV